MQMECTIDPKEDAGFRGKNFFTRDILPQKLLARTFAFERVRAFTEEEDVMILYIKKGHGTVEISGQGYEVKPGTLLILYPFHVKRLEAAKGQKLEGVECIVNIGTLLFMFAIPAYRRPVQALGRMPELYFLERKKREAIETLWQELLAENEILDCYFERIQLSLLMQILIMASTK